MMNQKHVRREYTPEKPNTKTLVELIRQSIFDEELYVTHKNYCIFYRGEEPQRAYYVGVGIPIEMSYKVSKSFIQLICPESGKLMTTASLAVLKDNARYARPKAIVC